jgi:uncharacterized membrane protein YciS (DUF1049 family)
MSYEFSSIPVGTLIAAAFFLGLLIGWVITYIESKGRVAKTVEAAETKAEIAINEAEKKIAEANQKLAEAPQQVPQVVLQDDPGLLRLKNKGGYFGLEIDGAGAIWATLASGCAASSRIRRLSASLNLRR